MEIELFMTSRFPYIIFKIMGQKKCAINQFCPYKKIEII